MNFYRISTIGLHSEDHRYVISQKLCSWGNGFEAWLTRPAAKKLGEYRTERQAQDACEVHAGEKDPPHSTGRLL